jgi:hypothetical protein
MARLFSYRVTHDYGFAPNPFFDYLTLATCKPGIRRTKTKENGDWVAGFSSKKLVAESRRYNVNISAEGLIYLMRITEVVTLEKYFDDSRFEEKKPVRGKFPEMCGDNIYYRDPATRSFIQEPSPFHGKDDITHDTHGEKVLISDDFWYFGRECLEPEPSWEALGINVPTGPTCYGWMSDDNALEMLRAFINAKTGKSKRIGQPCLCQESQFAPARSRCSS